MQIIVSGLLMGCIYALATLGLALIYKTTDVANFAQGEMSMVTTFVAFTLIHRMGFSYAASFLLALLFAALLGAVLYQLFMRRVRMESHLNQTVLTLGLFMILNGSAGLFWGYNPENFPVALKGDAIPIGSVHVTPNDLLTFGLTLFLMLLSFIVFRFTKIGLAMKASAQDIMAAELMGIQVSRVFTATWIISSILGGVAGMMTAPITYLSANMMADVLVMAFAGCVLGGFLSLPGVVVGGLIVGVFENVISYYISPQLKVVFTFALIVIVLYVRPQGIFGGAKFVKKV